MGREIRRVPPNYEHKQREAAFKMGGWVKAGPQPMYNELFDVKFAEWLADFDRIRAGNLDDLERDCYPNGLSDWLLDEGWPPDRDYYRTWSDHEATWFQVWETVSEGTPVSPPFATREELASYLAVNGDFWDQSRGHGGWGEENARAFCQMGWAPSMAIIGGELLPASAIPAALQDDGIAGPSDTESKDGK